MLERPDTYVISFRVYGQIGLALFEAAIANREPINLSGCPTHVREFQPVSQMMSGKYFFCAHRHPGVSYHTPPTVVAGTHGLRNEFSNHPCTFAIYQSLGALSSGIGSCLC